MSENSRFTAERLMGRAHPPGSPEEVAATCLRSAANRPVPGAVALARVRGRLDVSLARAGGSPWRWKTIVVVFALGMTLGGATAAAIWGAPAWMTMRAAGPVAPSPAPRANERKSRGRAHVPEAPAPVAPPLVEISAPTDRPTSSRPSAPPVLMAHAPGSPAPGVAEPSSRTRHAPPTAGRALSLAPSPAIAPALPAPGVVPPPVSSPSSLAVTSAPQAADAPASGELSEEARLLGLALQQLRRDHDASASLKTLDDHARRFPGTALRPEADVTRVEALLALDRRGEALVVLDGMSLPATARGRSLAVVRGELRAGAHRCPEAIPDFARALESSPHDPVTESALHGRIACLVSIGQNSAARIDAQTYLESFPSGRFVIDVRRVLGGAERR